MKNNDKKVIEVLTAVIARMHGETEYNALYNAYLLGQIGKDEFEDLSDAFISLTKYNENVFYKQVLDDSDKEKIDILFQHTKKLFTPTEIGDIFFLNDRIVEKYLEQKYEN